MKRLGLVAIVLALLVTGGGVAVARPMDAQRIFVVGRVEDPTATITASGVMHGTGTLTAESVSFDQAGLSYVETDLATVGNGTLTVVVHGAFDKWPFTLDPRTCTRFGRIFGTWTITGQSPEAGVSFTCTTDYEKSAGTAMDIEHVKLGIDLVNHNCF